MPPVVKPIAATGSTGKARSTYRQKQAAATKDRIAEAARELFAVGGYRPTSMEAVASAAGVAPRTVYSAFGAKREILSAICERWLEQAHALPIISMAIAEPDPDRTIRLAGYFLRSLFEHGYDVAVLFDAASDDDEPTREMLRAKLAGRHQAQDAIIATIHDELSIPLTAAQAVFRALAATGIYRELVVESDWSIDDFEEWVVDTLSRQLVRPAGGAPARPVAAEI